MDPEPVVFVVDDDSMILRAVDRLLRSGGFSVRTFDSPRAFLEQPPYPGPACLVLDLRMPELSGLDVQEALAVRGTPIPIVFFSGASNVPATAEAMRKGAIDFLVKEADDTALVQAVSRALETAVERQHRRRGEEDCRRRLARLTKRERQVCDLIAEGHLNKQIASDLGMSEATVKVHRGRVMRKLEVDSVASLVWLLSREAPPRTA
jgi:FixJ family two-component response regulator